MNLQAAKEKQRQEHIRKAQAHPAGMAAYCRESGITINALNYWRTKMRPESSVPDRDESPAFLAVQVAESEDAERRSSLPDPRWVAEVMLHLARGAEGRS
jgi:hypothetical protein